ncbi:MAG: flagellar biosynthetic protein FliR [Fibrobacterales bacterium]
MLEQAASIADITVGQLEFFFLMLIRVSVAIFLLPIFTGRNISARVKVGIVFFICILIFPLLPSQTLEVSNSIVHVFILTLKELFVGVIIGFTSSLLFTFIPIAGFFMARDMGLSMTPGIDPTTGDQSTGLGQLILVLFTVMFLINDNHHFFIEAVVESFRYIPIAGIEHHSALNAQVLLSLIVQSFVFGVKMAAPLMVIIILTTFGMAFMSKIMPQMNVWLVAIPLKIGIGVMVIIYTLPLAYQLLDKFFIIIQENLFILIRAGGTSA